MVTTAVMNTLSRVLVSTRTSSCWTRKDILPTMSSTQQMRHPRPGEARRLNLPNCSIMPTSAVETVNGICHLGGGYGRVRVGCGGVEWSGVMDSCIHAVD